jgi:hypothetical protein
MKIRILILLMLSVGIGSYSTALGQTVSGVRAFSGGVAPLFNLAGPGNLYLDNQGTQGYMYTPGNNFESYNYRNPTTGQAWSGAIMTLGPQLTIGFIQGANQVGSPVVLIPPPRDVGSPLIAPFSLAQAVPLSTPIIGAAQTVTTPVSAVSIGGANPLASPLISGFPLGGGVPAGLLIPPRQAPSLTEIESSLIDIP